MYDAIVIGARCAGSSTARLLANKGYRVLVVDRATFPSDTISTHIVWPRGLCSLRSWGLLDAVRESNCPPIREVTFDFGQVVPRGSSPPHEGIDVTYGPRRTFLDKMLLDAASASGAEIREGFSIQELTRGDDGAVTGIRGHARGGSTTTESARVVIGADGLHSVVARTAPADEYNVRPAFAFLYYSYWSGVDLAGLEYHVRDGFGGGALPTNDGLAYIIVAARIDGFSRFKADVEANYLGLLERDAAFAERVRAGTREERISGTAELNNLFRKPYGSGWALVGDAGYHKDPVTAQGITDAFRDAELLATGIDDAFSGRKTFDEALALYEKTRNDAVMPLFEFTCQTAKLDPPAPEFRALLSALRGNQPDTDRVVGAFNGTVPVPEFFAPDNVSRILTAAG
jgi:flavin-dependent dehydrogenase